MCISLVDETDLFHETVMNAMKFVLHENDSIRIEVKTIARFTRVPEMETFEHRISHLI